MSPSDPHRLLEWRLWRFRKPGKLFFKLSVMFIHRSGGHASSSSIEWYILYQNLFRIWGSWRVFWMVITSNLYYNSKPDEKSIMKIFKFCSKSSRPVNMDLSCNCKQGRQKMCRAPWIWIKKIKIDLIQYVVLSWILIKSSWSNFFIWTLIKSRWFNIFCPGFGSSQVFLWLLP